MASDIERLNRYTLFVDDRDDNDESPHHHNSLKRSQPSPTKETAKRNRLSLGEAGQPTKAPPRFPLPIKLQAAHNNNVFRNILVPVVPGSPWGKYEKTHSRELAGKVAIAVKLPAREEEFVVRSLSGGDVEEKLLNIRQFHDENLIRTYEIFAYNDGFYPISEPMCISLKHVCRCPKYPSEKQLLAIVKQVLNGICFLTSEKQAHKALTPPNILINADGSVKIANLEHCKTDDDCGRKNAESLGRVMMMLMDKNAKEKGELGLTRLDQWSELVVNFLSMTITSTPDDLQEHDFMKLKWSRGQLKWFVSYVQIKAKMD